MSTPIIAIDPGTSESAILLWRDNTCAGEIVPNQVILERLPKFPPELFPANPILAIEMIACYGMSVGKEVFETCVWIGRFYQAWKIASGRDPQLITRLTVKMHHCHSMQAKDSNIRQALIYKYGAPGTKKQQGVTYGLKSHLWSAFAIATYVSERANQTAFDKVEKDISSAFEKVP